MAKTIFAKQALLDEGWKENVYIAYNENGIQSIELNCNHGSFADKQVDIIIPGIPNLHSHSFQRAMAGLTEHKNPEHEHDDFWTWREEMFQLANKLTPEQIKVIYKYTYTEMLAAGYTSVAEFHYIYHDKEGRPYNPSTYLFDIIIAAAKEVGMPITMLPVFYAHSNFGGKEPHAGQKRFINTPENFLNMLGTLREKYANDPNVTIGMAFHSLRAATKEEMQTILESEVVKDKNFPIHIHVAEQTKEVEDCKTWSGNPPIQWLLDNFPVNERWTIIHATHMTQEEANRLAKTGAVVGFCPSTESNLGDGIGPAKEYIKAGGKWGVGSDSNVAVDAFYEAKLLEEAQRLKERQRNVLAIGDNSTGSALFRGALQGGQQALGLPVSGLKAGSRADFLVLDADHPSLSGKKGHEILGSLIFAPHKDAVLDVIANGKTCIHKEKPKHSPIEADYNKVVHELLGRQSPHNAVIHRDETAPDQNLSEQIQNLQQGQAMMMRMLSALLQTRLNAESVYQVQSTPYVFSWVGQIQGPASSEKSPLRRNLSLDNLSPSNSKPTSLLSKSADYTNSTNTAFNTGYSRNRGENTGSKVR